MTSTTFAPSSPVTVVDAMRTQLLDLGEVLWAARTPAERLAVVTSIEKLKSVLESVELRVIDEIAATNDAAREGWASTKDLVTAVSGGHHGSGASAVKLAHALGTDRTRTAEELGTARISRAQAQIIVRTIDSLPVKHALRARAEDTMIAHAQTLNASDLWTAGKHLIAVLDPDGDERDQERRLAREERAAHLNRFLTIIEDGAGGVRIKGRTTVEDAATIKAALFPLTAPVTTPPGSCGGHAGHPGHAGCAHDGRDPRDHGARFLDAFVEACRRLLTTKTVPESHGTPARLTLTMDYTDLAARIGTGTLDTGQSLSASAVRRLACDAEVIPIVLGSHSEVLDVGRLQRLVTPVIWTVLVARDRHCAFPGCTRPPIACDAHHITHWIDGGHTSLDNLALLCRAHHTTIHNTPWQIQLKPIDKKPEFIPPIRLDPQQTPIRHRQSRE